LGLGKTPRFKFTNSHIGIFMFEKIEKFWHGNEGKWNKSFFLLSLKLRSIAPSAPSTYFFN
jgi:hypothetical protein